MSLQVDIQVRRSSKVYCENENIEGIIILKCSSEYKHDGIYLTMEGQVNLKISPKNTSLLESFSNTLKPIQIAYAGVEISPSGKTPLGVTEIPFEIPLLPKQNRKLYETYHGVFVNIQYKLKCEVKKTLLSRDIFREIEFNVEYKKGYVENPNLLVKMKDNGVKFKITPDSLRVYNSTSMIPPFTVEGVLYNTICDITSPFTGELIITKKQSKIKSLEIQLVRVETCGSSDEYSKESTEIQNIQIVDGDVAIGLKIPIYMVFPRLFSCPTLITNNFKIEFEINLIIVLVDRHLITENFPVVLIRL